MLIKRKCIECNKNFQINKKRFENGRKTNKNYGTFCSRSCRSKYVFKGKGYRKGKKNKIDKSLHLKCIICGKSFKVDKSREWQARFCSLKCKGKGQKKWQSNNKHWNWKGGITEENQKIRSSIEYKEWRYEVYVRDKFHCQICDTHCNGKTIVAHHIKSFKDYPELRFTVSNGITLCRRCHARLHKLEYLRLMELRS